ncbi:DUF2306 domain-containing protein [Taibaiella koreensis]|uniref:DUF2306 domain-containing protein n=1 Tax=Taibaiella koreensis TaxID=1268548 RepID=UPI0013C2BE77|nr:DUF2306 domain-containing protein [Taibaiella koreensis]
MSDNYTPTTGAKIFRSIFWFLFVILAVIVGLYPVLYFFSSLQQSFLSLKDRALLTNPLWHISFYTHIITGGLALLCGWVQFSGAWRRKYPAFHRGMGWFYTLLALPAAASGIGLAGVATGGAVSRYGFALLGIFWLAVTYMALYYAQNNRILRHRQMALYSYAACFAAVTLRCWLQLFLHLAMDFILAYRIVAWLCWTPNVVVAFVLNRKANSAFARKNEAEDL